MRKAFDPQRRLDCPAVNQIKLNFNCRAEIIPVLRALQYLYGQPKLLKSILALVAEDINKKSDPERGREGLDYWVILVLAAVRLGCDYDYDQLQDLAENHRQLRQIMGIGEWQEEEESFNWRRIRDNICLLDPETIEKINHVIIGAGHELAPEAVKTVRADSFVAGTNIHYPTESSLIRDGLRKVLSLAAELAVLHGLTGWRQHKHLWKKIKRLVRNIERIAARKKPGYQEELKSPYRELLTTAESILNRTDELHNAVGNAGAATAEPAALGNQLAVFVERTRQVCGTAYRRVFLDEKVPNNEKLFSIFETHTQLYKRGKASQPIQFGRLVLVYEDGVGFVTHHHVLPREANDPDVVVEETRRLQERMNGRIERASFDRGFHSPENQKALAEIIDCPCLPKPGARQAAEQDKEASVAFHAARQRHPGIESAIGALQSGNGLARCRDRSERGFLRYIALGILGRNLHVLGKLLIARESPDSKAAYSKRKPAA
ncbi:MAG: ISNCY family transposase [Rhodocyclaceae bacterium]|nr:ISNCY family transposase [Rhodocyclaceae bacterium]